MKKIPATPFVRRNLDTEIAGLRDNHPDDWESAHLRRAHEIVEKRVGLENAKEIVIQAVRAAHRVVTQAYQDQLGEARRSALRDFSANCKAIANCATPKRLAEVIREQLDQCSKSSFADGVVDLETLDMFFRRCTSIVKSFPEDKTASKILKHLVTDKDDRTHGDVVHLGRTEGKGEPPREDRAPKIALDYEVLPTAARLACESGLAEVIAEKSQSLTAHTVFECLHKASEAFVSTAALEKQPRILHQYLADLDALWATHGLEIGRGNNPEDNSYSSPFQEFSERILVAWRDPRSRLFDPISDEEKAAAWTNYHEIPTDFFIPREDISAMPFAGIELITDWTLRTYLNRRPTSKKSE